MPTEINIALTEKTRRTIILTKVISLLSITVCRPLLS